MQRQMNRAGGRKRFAGAELMAADSEVADADFAAEQQVNARVPKGMEELVPDMMPETISEEVKRSLCRTTRWK